MRSLFALVVLCLAFLAISYASPYNKYGRTCKDILCTVREECVMQRDECTGFSDKCGTYPTCKRKPGVGKTGCAAMRCPTGHFCSIRQENCDKPPCQIKPTCIAFRTPSPSRAANVPDETEQDSSIPTLPPLWQTPSPPSDIKNLDRVKETRTSGQSVFLQKPDSIQPSGSVSQPLQLQQPVQQELLVV